MLAFAIAKHYILICCKSSSTNLFIHMCKTFLREKIGNAGPQIYVFFFKLAIYKISSNDPFAGYKLICPLMLQFFHKFLEFRLICDLYWLIKFNTMESSEDCIELTHTTFYPEITLILTQGVVKHIRQETLKVEIDAQKVQRRGNRRYQVSRKAKELQCFPWEARA